MPERAIPRNQTSTAARIARCAQRLAEERGIDGFTMDELAEHVGVSRRTLFNHVSGKMDAVLGAPERDNPSQLDEFRAGGPTGRLTDDVRTVIEAMLDRHAATAEDAQRAWRLIASDPRIHKAMHDKFTQIAEFMTGAIMEREGTRLTPFQVRAAARVTLSLLDVAFESFVADPGTSLTDHYTAAFNQAAALFD